MPRDIRSFFTVISKKSSANPSSAASTSTTKKPKRIIDSDDEDFIQKTPVQDAPKHKRTDSVDQKNKSPKINKKTAKKQTAKKAVLVLSSSSEDEEPKKISKKKKGQDSKEKIKTISSSSGDEKKKSLKNNVKKEKQQPVKVTDFFLNTPVKQSAVVAKKNEIKEKSKSEREAHNDTDFEKTLEDLDDDFFTTNMNEIDKAFEEASETRAIPADRSNKKRTPPKITQTNTPKKKKLDGSTPQKTEKAKKTNDYSDAKKIEKEVHNDEKFAKTLDDDDLSDQNISLIEKSQIEETPIVNKNSKKRTRRDSGERKTPKKTKLEHTDSGIDPGQEAHEKRRFSAMLYQKYLNRSGPKHLGTKELPKGKPTCLANLCFLRTGVLDSLDNDDFTKLIQDHGGRVVHGVSKKVNYIVVGDEPGPAKLAKAESYNIPLLSEDELLDLILKKSGMEPKYAKRNNSGSSEDQGIGSEKDDHVLPTDLEDAKPSKKQNTTTKTKSPVKKKTEMAPERKIEPKKEIKDSKEIPLDPSLPLTEKYRPQTLNTIVGQQNEQSSMFKLKRWLENWEQKRKEKSLVRPNPWSKNNDGSFYKCALLSGPPGVGKTTTATVVAKELGFDIVEFNASDTRSKKSLHEEVAQLLQTRSIASFASGKNNSRKRVLLMDEVDGMAGNEDRGGMQEFIQLIKSTNIPIICMCNDRNHQKMRSLLNYCYDLRFTPPKMEQIRGAMMTVCFKEGINISPQALADIINGTGCDIRQTLNHLSILGAANEKITHEMAEKEAKSSKKDTVMGPWEVCRIVFTKNDHKDLTLAEKARLFFYDYSLGPLFIQENYLKVSPANSDKKEALQKAALAAASLSCGDLIENKIRRGNNWSLLESQAFFSCVIPGHYMSGSVTSQINFPSWLGKNSKRNKFNRLHSQIRTHIRTTGSASSLGVKLDYLIPLRDAICLPLKTKGLDGINQAVSVMKEYNLLREDLDGLLELSGLITKVSPMAHVETKVKTAFTKAYNKQVALLPFAASSVSKKKLKNENEELGENESDEGSEEEDDITKNSMIKVKNSSKKKKAEGPSTSKKDAAKKGRGRAKK